MQADVTTILLQLNQGKTHMHAAVAWHYSAVDMGFRHAYIYWHSFDL